MRRETNTQDPPDDLEVALDATARVRLHGVLVRYRVMAYVTAVLLIVLVFAGVPLQLAAGQPKVANVVGTVHGFCYIVYLFAAFDLTRRLRLRFTRMLLVLLAGTVPFCAIVAERLLTRMYERVVATPLPASSPASDAGVEEGGQGA
ncbi:MAG TPA: DUF3817 domain-containing protein [Acidimicrobiales bacterium]|nr:DUF3817 domain-containing protein [Acidimicrobiales bacterium]